MKEIILASSSPRRKEILERFGLKPKIISSNIDEIEREDESPIEVVMALAFEKANQVNDISEEGNLIIAADTVVVFDGEILGKPKDEEEAFKILNRLNGKKHRVITGIAIIESGTNKKIIDYEETEVEFKDSSEEKLRSYIGTEEYKDKAGGYGIQGYGQLLVKRIEGSYLNVVGFPLELVEDILKKEFEFKII